MKNLSIRILSLCAILLLLIASCKKDKSTLSDYISPFNYRIVSEVWYENDQFSDEYIYEYSGNRITKISSISENYVVTFEYPDNNTIIFNFSDEGSGRMTLSNNKVTEMTLDNEQRVAFNYNSEGRIENIKYYDYNSSDYYDDITFTYSSGKLVQVIDSYPDEEPPSEYRSVYTYNGDEHKEVFNSSRVSGGQWEESGKSVYTYINGKISKITNYVLYDSEYNEYQRYEFIYDSNDNLIQKSEFYQIYESKVEYNYEEEGGNYRQLFEFLEGVDYEIDWEYNFGPQPNKSQTLDRHNLSTHYHGPLNFFTNR
jgi:hypothetical protein